MLKLKIETAHKMLVLIPYAFKRLSVNMHVQLSGGVIDISVCPSIIYVPIFMMNVLARPCIRAVWPEPSLITNAIITKIACAGLNPVYRCCMSNV